MSQKKTYQIEMSQFGRLKMRFNFLVDLFYQVLDTKQNKGALYEYQTKRPYLLGVSI